VWGGFDVQNILYIKPQVMIPLISNSTAFTYQHLIKPVFFKFEAEKVHEGMVMMGELMGRLPLVPVLTRAVYAFQDPRLEQDLQAIHFSNPIGLAAGFDYNAQLTSILGPLGFGFQSLGSITAEAYGGNEPPRLGRLPKSRSLLVNKGYKNPGIDAVIAKLQPKTFPGPVGMSIGSTNKVYNNDHQLIENILISFQKAQKKLTNISYYELNISCPNLKNGEPFLEPKTLKQLLAELEALHISVPIFLKMPIDISSDQSSKMLKIADKFTIAGAIYGNLTKDRKNPDLVPEEVAAAGRGNFSGKPTERRSNALLESAYREYSSRFTFIGCGGVFSPEDVYRKIRLGASLVQMITGMIYQGPQLIGQINKGLVDLLECDGFESINEAVGADVN